MHHCLLRGDISREALFTPGSRSPEQICLDRNAAQRMCLGFHGK